MGDGEALIEELAGNDNRYILVRPCGGLYGGYEVVNVWNGDVKWRGLTKDAAMEKAQEWLKRSASFDHIIEVHEGEA
jgi:hypothetical protein